MKSTIKMVFPPTFYYETSLSLNSQLFELYKKKSHPYIPYGMAIITSFLRKHQNEVSQVDLNEKISTFNSRLNDRGKNRIELNDLSIISSQLENHFPNDLKNSRLERLVNQIFELLELNRVDILGFSLLGSPGIISAILLAERVKQSFKNIKIVFGGPPITFNVNDYFDRYKFIDYLIEGEGEVPFLKLIKHFEGELSIDRVPNLIYRRDRKIVRNGIESRSLEDQSEPDFDGLSLGYYSFVSNSQLIFPIPYAVARWCKHRCNYCQNVQKYETKTFKKVIYEMKFLMKKYQSKYFRLVSPNIDHAYLKGFCNEIIGEGLKINWTANVTISELDGDLLYKMREAGCEALKIGIESGSNLMLQRMNKSFTIEKAEQVLKYSSSLGIKNYINLMVGYPYESLKDISLSIQFIKKVDHCIEDISLFPFTLMKKSPIYQYAENNRVKVLYPIDVLSSAYAYNEIDGLSWKRKIIHQELLIDKIIDAVLLFYLRKNYKKKGNLYFFLVYVRVKIKKLLSAFRNIIRR